MITVIRDRLLKNKTYKYFVWFLVIALAIVWTVPVALKKMSGGQWVARVNGQEIDYADFVRKARDKEYRVQMMRQEYGSYADMFLQAMGIADPRVWALEELIREQLLTQEAATLGIRLGEEYVIQKLADQQFVFQALSDLVPPYAFDVKSGAIHQAQLNAYLRSVGLSMADFEERVEQALMRSTVVELVALASYVPLFELIEQFKARELGKNMTILVYSLDAFAKKARQEKIADQEMSSFFGKQSAQGHYWVPEKRAARVWKFDPARYGITVTDEAMKEYYDAHKMSSFLEKPAQLELRTLVVRVANEQEEQAAYARAKEIRQDLLAHPETFADKARELSSDKESASRGGLLPAFAKGAGPKALEKAAFLLKDDGAISDIIRTDKGFEIIQRVQKKAPVFKLLDEVKKEVRAALMDKEFSASFARDVGHLIEKKQLSPADLEAFATAHGGVAKNYTDRENDGSKLAGVLFALAENAVDSYLEGSAGYLVRSTAIAKRHLPALDAVRDAVADDIYQARAAKKIQELAKQAEDLVIKGSSLSAIAMQQGATVKVLGMVKQSDMAKIKELQAQGLPVEQMLQLERQGLIRYLEKDRNGYLVQVNSLEAFNEDDFKAKKAGLAQKLSQEAMQASAEGFVASLYRNATIDANESLLNSGLGRSESSRNMPEYEE